MHESHTNSTYNFFYGATARNGPGPPLYRGYDHTQTHHTHSVERVITPKQRPLPDNIQHSQETYIYASGGIRIRNPSKRAAAEPHLRQRSIYNTRPY
jgi:hypothetical protein